MSGSLSTKTVETAAYPHFRKNYSLILKTLLNVFLVLN